MDKYRDRFNALSRSQKLFLGIDILCYLLLTSVVFSLGLAVYFEQIGAEEMLLVSQKSAGILGAILLVVFAYGLTSAINFKAEHRRERRTRE